MRDKKEIMKIDVTVDLNVELNKKRLEETKELINKIIKLVDDFNTENEEEKAPAVTDAQNYLTKEDFELLINNYTPNIMQLNFIKDCLKGID